MENVSVCRYVIRHLFFSLPLSLYHYLHSTYIFIEQGFSGSSCEIDTCDDKKKCNGNGICKENTCSCYPGYEGDACDLVTPCPNDCSEHGSCKYGKCFCDPAYEGEDCSKKSSCEADCSGNGICVKSKCVCEEGWKGDTCSEMTSKKPCPNDCSVRRSSISLVKINANSLHTILYTG